MSGERILIVDEQPKIARRMARALLQEEEADFQVDVCTDAEQALDRLAESPVHIIVADMRIPGMNGLDLLEEVRKRSPKTRCILTTGYSTPAVQERANALKIAAYIVKPFTMADFIEAVKRALPPPDRAPEDAANAAAAEAITRVQTRIETLVRDVGAMGALVLSPSGQLITECGQHGDFDTNAFLALVGNTMAAANAVSHMLGDADALDLHFHEGKNYAIYTARINDSVFLSLILPQSTSSRIGLVWLALRRAVTDLRALVADAAFNTSLPISNEFVDALDDALDIALGPTGGVGPDETPDLLADIAPATPKPAQTPPRVPLAPEPPPQPPLPEFNPMDAPDPLAAMMASGELETVDRGKTPLPFERDDSYDPLAGLITTEQVEPVDVPPPVAPPPVVPPKPRDVLDLNALVAPGITPRPKKEPAPAPPPEPPVKPKPAPPVTQAVEKPGKPAPVAPPKPAEQPAKPAPAPVETPAPEPPKAPPPAMPELIDLDKLFDVTEDDGIPLPPPAEEPKLSYEEAKKLGLIDF